MTFPKILICIPSPRDITRFKQSIDTVKEDKLWVKYRRAQPAYDILRDYFLDHSEYDYFALCPDDLIVTQDHVNQLKEDIRQTNKPYPVLTGVCNLDMTPYGQRHFNICVDKMPSDNRDARTYEWARILYRDVRKYTIKRVKFAGFPFMFIRRDVIEQIPFRNDRPWPDPTGCCRDVMFCNDCAQRRIPIYTDFRVRMLHLKKSKTDEMRLLVGIKEPQTIEEKL